MTAFWGHEPVAVGADGVWVAYHSDWSGLAFFATELEALRHAVTNSMSVGYCTFGADYGGGRYPQPNPSNGTRAHTVGGLVASLKETGILR
jgi:hypothetical protein